MPTKKLKKYLDDQHIKYEIISHLPTSTAQETAATAHIPGKDLAKTVILKVDGQMAMAVLPASHEIDLERFKQAAHAQDVQLAEEREFQDRFPECEVGAMPPFGNLYNMKVYVANDLAEDEQIAFDAGTHSELVQLAYRDYQRLAEPTVAAFARHR